jgi:hypothetical protein
MDRGESFQLAIGYPQLEYAATPTTRMIGTRAPDVLSFSPSYTFDNSYGKFIIEFSPNYAGTPGAAGPQLLLDTRDSSGRNGFWIGHRQDGLFEFGAADNTGSVFVRSASVMQLVENAVCTITAWFDSTLKSLRLDLNGVVMVEKTLGSFTVPTVLNQMKFGTKYDGTTASSFELVSFKHIMSTE